MGSDSGTGVGRAPPTSSLKREKSAFYRRRGAWQPWGLSAKRRTWSGNQA